MDEQSLQGMAQEIQSNVPLDRFGQPDEIAAMAVALFGLAGTYMTGEEVVLDGGWTNL